MRNARGTRSEASMACRESDVTPIVLVLRIRAVTLRLAEATAIAAHAIVAVGPGRNVGAREPVAALRLEKSTGSRPVGALVADGLRAAGIGRA